MLWLKAFHIIFVVCWFAGLFYLPRLYVYHTELSLDDPNYKRFCTMERKLFWGIMTPSAVLSLVFGFALLGYWMQALSSSGWLHTKLLLIAILLAYHVACWHYLRLFAKGANPKSHVFYRIFNEIPVLILIAVVILVVVKPF